MAQVGNGEMQANAAQTGIPTSNVAFVPIPQIDMSAGASSKEDFQRGVTAGNVGSVAAGINPEVGGEMLLAKTGEKVLQTGGDEAATAVTKVAEAPKPVDSPAPGAQSAKKTNLNSNGATSNYGIYEIKVNGNLQDGKIGKADLNRVTQSSGLPTRLHQQVRKLEEIHGKGNVEGKVVEDLGQTTTAQAKAAETSRLQKNYDETGTVPEGNKKSFKPNQ